MVENPDVPEIVLYPFIDSVYSPEVSYKLVDSRSMASCLSVKQALLILL